MSHSTIKVELRVFTDQEHRDAHWQEDGNDLLSDPKDYGLSKLDYAATEAQLERMMQGKDPNTCAFTKILGRRGRNQREACHSQEYDVAVGWFYNP